MIPGWIPRLLETDPEQMVPYAGHVGHNPRIAMLFGNTAMTMYRLRGLPFELTPNAIRNGRNTRINTLLRALSDPDLTVCIHLVHHLKTTSAPQRESDNAFVRSLMRDYQRSVLQRTFVNDWYITLLAAPPKDMARSVLHRMTFGLLGGERSMQLDPDRELLLEDVGHLLEKTLGDYGIRRLGLAEHETANGASIPISEIGTAVYAIRNAHERLIPHTIGPLGNSVYPEPAVFEARKFKPNIPGLEDRTGAMIGFLNYPSDWTVGMFDALLTADYPFVMGHSFEFKLAHKESAALKLTRRQMVAAGDEAGDLIDGLGQAINKSQSLKTSRGRHNFSLAVYADDPRMLNMHVADATHKLQEHGGANPVRELNVWGQGALEASYYMQLPGYRGPRPRPGRMSGADLAAMASFDTYPTGAPSGYWGASQLRFRLMGGTVYDYVSHVEDVGHTLIIGHTGSGKTVLVGFLLCALEPTMGKDGIRLLIDKDQSSRLTIEASGGNYAIMKRNQPSGLAPLVAYGDSARTRSFLHRTYRWCIERDGFGAITSAEDARLMRGIVCQLGMPPARRSMGGVREFLGYSDTDKAAGARFERWCRGGTMGWLLDNDQHVIDIDAGLYGIDFTDLIPRDGQADDGACMLAASVIAHQLADKTDGRRIVTVFDECRFYVDVIPRLIEDFTLTGRKNELMCVPIFQEAGHATASVIGQSLVAQMRTKFIAPDVNHSVAALRRLEVSHAAVRMLKGEMTLGTARRWLLWRGDPDQSAVLEFDLSALPQLSILSGRSGTTRLWERIKAEGGTTEDFLERLEHARSIAA